MSSTKALSKESLQVVARGKLGEGWNVNTEPLTVNPNTSRGVFFALNAIKTIEEIVIRDGASVKAIITPKNHAANGEGVWIVSTSGKDGKDVEMPRGQYLDEKTGRFDRRQDINQVIRQVLHLVNAAFPEFGSREFGGEVSKDKADYVLYLHNVKHLKAEDISTHKMVKLNVQTVQRIIDGK